MSSQPMIVPAAGARPPHCTLLPTIGQLAALGPVLCGTRRRCSAIDGWQQAASATVGRCHGQECLVFHDRMGRICWQLLLLPVSNWYQWDLLCSQLGERGPADQAGWRRWQRWVWTPLRLQARAGALATLPVGLSAAGRQLAGSLPGAGRHLIF